MGIQKSENLSYLQKWYLDLKPATITFYNSKTEARIVEPSYVAVSIQSGGAVPPGRIPLGRPLAVGKAALSYQNTQDTAVFSPFRDGEIADYGLSLYFLRSFLTQITPRFTLFKPVFCIRTQEQTSSVQERAWIDAGLQLGARRVYLYDEAFSAILNQIPKNKSLKDAVIIHIEPQN